MPKKVTTAPKEAEAVTEETESLVDFKLIAIALVSTVLELTRLAPKAGDWGYVQELSQYQIGDLVANISDRFADEDCLNRVGTVLEIRESDIEIRCLDGVSRCAIARTGTYIAAKGERNG
jgi:hypothetical protein